MVQGYTKTAHMVWDGNGILRIYILQDSEIDLEQATENNYLCTKLTSGRKFLALTYGNVPFSVTPEARAFWAQPSISEVRIASAFITNTLANKLMANFYTRFNKPAVPTRVFTSEQSAHEWLLTFMPALRAAWMKEAVEKSSS